MDFAREYYDSASKRSALITDLGERPKGILDLDGCSIEGWAIAPKMEESFHEIIKERFPECAAIGDSKIQDIPYGIPYQQLVVLKEEGFLQKSITVKQMDVRLPPFTVSTLNDPLSIIRSMIMPLTSRPDDHFAIIARESGVRSIDDIVCATEASGIIRYFGQKELTHQAFDVEGERKWLAEAQGLKEKFIGIAGNILSANGFGNIPPAIAFQNKLALGAINTDWRPILKAAGQAENSPLDMALHAAWNDLHRELLDRSPKLADGSPAFHARPGPCNEEVQNTDVDKGFGARRLIELDRASEFPATGYLIADDDVAHKGGKHGTGAPAALVAPILEREFGVPVRFVHVHHPVEKNLRGRTPDPAHSLQHLPPHLRPVVALVVPTPFVLNSMMQETLRPAQRRIRANYRASLAA